VSYKLGQQPWIRQRHDRDSIVCPFCGDSRLDLSVGDFYDDHLRLELHCDSPECDVRTMAVVALRIGVPNRRPDARMLQHLRFSSPDS
jgi:hypothetical protein